MRGSLDRLDGAGEGADGFRFRLIFRGKPERAWESELWPLGFDLKENEASIDLADALDARDDFLADVAALLVVDGACFYSCFWREKSRGEFMIPLWDSLSDSMILQDVRGELIDLVCLKELGEILALRHPQIGA